MTGRLVVQIRRFSLVNNTKSSQIRAGKIGYLANAGQTVSMFSADSMKFSRAVIK
jgi:hypothetical protein